jgi:hypothetical protein
MVEYKTPGEIDAMHAAGQVVARILAAVRERAGPGCGWPNWTRPPGTYWPGPLLPHRSSATSPHSPMGAALSQ